MNADSIDPATKHKLNRALEQLFHTDRPRLRRLAAYYKNTLRLESTFNDAGDSHRPYRQAQEWGLPSRITGVRAGIEPFSNLQSTGVSRKEIVIENDIAWRLDTMVDYLFAKPLVITSTAANPARQLLISKLLRTMLGANGGIQFFQQVALTGAIHGFVDIVVKIRQGALDAFRKKHPTALLDTQSSGPATLGQLSNDAPVQTRHTETVNDAQITSENNAGPQHTEQSSPDANLSETPREATPAPPEEPDQGGQALLADTLTDEVISQLSSMIHLELVEPARALPLLCPDDCRKFQAYAQVWEEPISPAAPGSRPPDSWWDRFRQVFSNSAQAAPPAGLVPDQMTVEILTDQSWLRVKNGRTILNGPNPLGRVPVVHIQNTASPFSYSGQSDVEPLIPLQDELNTRLSDRAHRITLQSFRMYLAKGFDQFIDQPVSPGRMWATDNEDAEIEEFGGDAHCPSEEAHIADIREALDKSSGVTPIAAGAIKNRIGRLTSAAALRITLLALLSKTDKKRTLYGAGIERMCELALAWLDALGVFPNRPEERRIEIHWPSPLPENDIERLQEAQIKMRLGIDPDVVRKELGY